MNHLDPKERYPGISDQMADKLRRIEQESQERLHQQQTVATRNWLKNYPTGIVPSTRDLR